MLLDEVPQLADVQHQPWPPPELEVLCSVDINSCQLTNSRVKWYLNALFSGVHEWPPDIKCVQHASVTSYIPLWHEQQTTDILLQVLVHGSVLTSFFSDSSHLRVAGFLYGGNPLKFFRRAQGLTAEHLVATGIHQNIEAKQPDTTPGHFLDHHSRLGFVILDVLITRSLAGLYCGNTTAIQSSKETMCSELVCYYLGFKASKFHPVPVLELQGSACNLFSSGMCQARKVQSYMKLYCSDYCGEGIYFKVEHLSDHVAQRNIHGASHSGGCDFSATFPMCIDMRMDQSKKSGELIQWLANNHSASDVSAIRSLHNVSTLFFSVLMGLDGAANQYWKIQRDPGGCMFTFCSSRKRCTTPLYCYEQLQWLSLRLEGAFQIWLVAWIMDDLEFSLDHVQVPFQGGRNVIRLAFSDHIQDSHDYYLAFINQIPIGHDYCLEGYHNDSSKSEHIHIPWDPGKSFLCYHASSGLGTSRISRREGC